MSERDPRDLVVIALSGVQRYITESRTTADLRAASQIVAHLAAEAVDHLDGHSAKMVFPAPVQQSEQSGKRHKRGTEDGMPNRVVALLPEGTGPTAAKHTAKHLDAVWKKWMQEVFDRRMPQVPGWPAVQWVSVPAGLGSYAQAWKSAQRSLAQRKNTRAFRQPEDTPGELCMLSPRWRAVDFSHLPPRTPTHLKQERLGAANWVKRLWHHTSTGSRESFSSTNAISSLPYRHAILTRWENTAGIRELVVRLRQAARDLGNDPIEETPTPGLPPEPRNPEANWLRERGGRWIYPEAWHVDALAREFTETAQEADRLREDPRFMAATRSGYEAAQNLEDLMVDQGVPAPSPHLAVLVQDLDSMGKHLSGEAPGQDGQPLDLSRGHTVHTDVSARLAHTAARQRKAIEKVGGVVVYAGGDDLLALVPAASALEATRACRNAGDPGLPHASNGLMFFHHGASLHQALAGAQELLERAKELSNKNGLGVGFVRSSGSHASCVLPWQEEPEVAGSPVEALELFITSKHHPRVRLSPRLLSDLLAEQFHLDGGGQSALGEFDVLPYRAAHAEMRRLVLRHTSLSPPLPRSVHCEQEYAESTLENNTDHGTDPVKQDHEEREDFATKAARALERMAPHGRRLDEDAIRVALFLRQEAH